jgi:hypothetical protein
MITDLAIAHCIDLQHLDGAIAKFKLFLHSKHEISKPEEEVQLKIDVWQINEFEDFKATFMHYSYLTVDLEKEELQKDGKPVETLIAAPNYKQIIQQIRNILQGDEEQKT